MKILIGYDGSPSADAVLDDLPRAGLGDDVEAIVLCVADVSQHLLTTDHARSSANRAVEESKSIAQHAAEMLRKKFPAWKIQSDACVDAPYRAISLRAKEIHADLVVIGAFGGVSQKVLAHTACSVRFARTGRLQEPRRVVIGFDESVDSHATIAEVARRTWSARTEAIIVMGLDLQMSCALADPESARAVCMKAVAQLERAGITTAVLVEEFDPRTLIERVARESDAACIFLGSRGQNRPEKFLSGSVAFTVAARASCSVEIVR